MNSVVCARVWFVDFLDFVYATEKYDNELKLSKKLIDKLCFFKNDVY